MTISVNMLAPQAGQTYIARSGNSYSAGVNGIITGVLPGDIDSLTNSGCIVIIERPVVKLPQSTAAIAGYLAQGAVNLVAASTFAVALALAVPVALGVLTTINSLSTGNTTVTSSGVTLLDEKGNATTVLTCALGVADIEFVGSTLYQIRNRSIASNTSAAITYGITSS